MEALEKQKLCLDILEKIIHLRTTFQATYENYNACSKTLAILWENGLDTFIEEKYFANIIQKYEKLYENNCAVYASIPLKILVNYTRVSLTSSSEMEISSDARGYTPSAEVLCGIDRTKNKEKDFNFPSRSVPLPFFYLQNPALDTIKIPSHRRYSKHSIGCLINSDSFFALLYLLHYGKTKLIADTIPAVSKALYSSACELANAALKNPLKNKLKISEIKDLSIRIWLEKMANEIQNLDLEVEKKKLNNQLFTSKFSQAIGQYLKMAKSIIPLLPPFPEKLKRCSFDSKRNMQGFALNIDLDPDCEYEYRRSIGEKDEGFYLKLGNNNNLSLLEYPYEDDKNRYKTAPPSFEEELPVIYMALTSLIDKHPSYLEGIKITLIEAEKQYLNYLNACLTIKAAFKTQMLLTKI
jgi:hypothetical protein